MNKVILKAFVPISLLLLSGCSMSNPSLNEIKEERVLLIEEVKKIDKIGFQKSEELGVYKDKGIVAYVGPSPALSKEEYSLLKFAEEPLLFNGFGLDNYIYMLINESDLNSAEEKAKNLGYKNVKEMFDHIYDMVHFKNSDQLLLTLKYLEEKKLISSIENLQDKQRLENETSKIVARIYSPYYDIEKNIDPSGINKEWFITLKKQKVSISRDEYKPYAFTILLMKEILSSNTKGVKLNGI